MNAQPTTRRRITALAAAVCLAGLPAATVGRADNREALEYEVKAAMLVNFAKFVDWPAQAFPDSRAPLVIALVGRDPFGGLIEETVRDRVVGGHPIVVRKLEALPARESAAHIVFLARSEKRRSADLLAALAGRPVLTVSDAEGFTQAGGMIGLSIENERVAFQVNRGAAQRAGLSISSRLLKLASSIADSGPAAAAVGGGPPK